MYGYIYKTTNLYNGKIYVGQHKASKFNPNYYGSGVRITNVLNKFGTDNFICELLEKCYSEAELNEKEIYWIKKLNSTDREIGYNLMSGGYKVRGARHSKETREKISRSKKGCHPKRDYTKVSKETRKKISNTLKQYYTTHTNAKKGTTLSEETKEKLRQCNLGKTYPEEVRMKHRGRPAWNKGIPMSQEAKDHLSKINTGKKQNLSLEKRKQKSERMKGANNPNYGGLKEETKEKIRKSASGKVWVNNGIKRALIKKEKLQEYLDKGYVRGKNLLG